MPHTVTSKPRASARWLRRLVRPLPNSSRTTKEGHLLAALDLDHERGCHATPSLNTVYNVGHELGEGRTAVVHEGRDKRAAAGTWGRCALKLFQVQEMREDDEAVEMIRDEVAVLLLLPRHPCVVQLLQVVSTPDVIALALELVAGGDLFSMIEASGPCPEARARSLLLQILDGLGHLHSHGISHRDLKPENICFVDSSQCNLKLIDLGAAAFITPDGFTDLAGTPLYAAPEICPWFFQENGESEELTRVLSWGQVEDALASPPALRLGEVAPSALALPNSRGGLLVPAAPHSLRDVLPAPYGPEVDFWAVGALLYVILSGEAPFDQEKDVEDLLNEIAAMRTRSVNMTSDAWGGVSETAKDLVHRLIEPSPQRRLNGAGARAHLWLAAHCVASPPPLPPRRAREQTYLVRAGVVAETAEASDSSKRADADVEVHTALAYLARALNPRVSSIHGDLRLLVVPEPTATGRVVAYSLRLGPQGLDVLLGALPQPPLALAACTRGALLRWAGGEAPFAHAAKLPSGSLAPRLLAAFAPDRRQYRAYAAERGGAVAACAAAYLASGPKEGKPTRAAPGRFGRGLSFSMRARSKSLSELSGEPPPPPLPPRRNRGSSPDTLSAVGRVNTGLGGQQQPRHGGEQQL